MTQITDFYGEEDLIERLTAGVAEGDKQVVFVLGSAVSCYQTSKSLIGVPNVSQIIELIQNRFKDGQLNAFEHHLDKGENPYQDAFKFLLGRRGPEATNGLIKTAVAKARRTVPNEMAKQDEYAFNPKMTDEICRSFEQDISGWTLTPATDAVGRLAAKAPDVFGRLVITTNFDPLLSVSVLESGGNPFRSFYHRDGNISQAAGPGTHIAHLHGYWYGSDTLHTPKQLQQERPQLKSSLAQIFRDHVTVFIGYGGWDDSITNALADVIKDDSAFPEIIWTFFEEDPNPRSSLASLLQPGIDRGRVNVYSGIDCHSVLPKIANYFAPVVASTSDKSQPKETASQPLFPQKPRKRWANLEDDKPPRIDIFVGRGEDIKKLEQSEFRIGFITGIGGQGKSALASKYFSNDDRLETFDHRLWRDCREQGAPFQDQLLSLVEVLNDGQVTSAEIAQQSDDSLIDLFCDLTQDFKLLIVFDNIDHYVDLVTLELFGLADRFLKKFIESNSSAQIIFTCRPNVHYDALAVHTQNLSGLSLDATKSLFLARAAKVAPDELRIAHDRTKGHPFWLDLLAAQVAKRTQTLSELVSDSPKDDTNIPDETLRSIWSNLNSKEQMTLQALAETVRPTNTLELSDYLGSSLRFRHLEKSIKSLKDLNLVVIKVEDEKELYELHPVIRKFITNTFKREQREPFIEAIIAVYDAMLSSLTGTGIDSYDSAALQRWMESVELLLNAGKFQDALDKLGEVSSRFRTKEPPNEFLSLCDRLFVECDFSRLVPEPKFESLFNCYIDLLTNLGRSQDAASALEDYFESLEGKGARYIHYCDMQTYLHWRSEDYGVAIKWGKRGAELKKKTDVDTVFDTQHNLALAERDSGAVEPALRYFLAGKKLKDIISEDTLDPDRDEAYYGNIGRCLHLMGQIDNSLLCYRKSGKVLERLGSEGSIENQAFLRQWVGELLWVKSDIALSKQSLQSAWAKWKIVSPPKANRLVGRARDEMKIDVTFDVGEIDQAERAFRAWVSSK